MGEIGGERQKILRVDRKKKGTRKFKMGFGFGKKGKKGEGNT